MISGALNSATNNAPITNGHLSGDEISSTAGGAQYAGRVNGNAMQGIFKSGGSTGTWSAARMGE